MGDWSDLPHEIIHMISLRMDNPFDLIHFRSVCSWWRSSSLSTFRPPPSLRCPLPLDVGGCGDDCHILRSRLYLIKTLSCDPPQIWLFKLYEEENAVQTLAPQCLFNRRTSSELGCSYPSLSPNLLNSQVTELAQEHFACYTSWCGLLSNGGGPITYEENISFMWLDTENKEFIVMGRLSFCGLGMYRSFEGRWTEIETIPGLSLDLLNSQVIELAQEDVACYTYYWSNMFDDGIGVEFKPEERIGLMSLGADNKQFMILGRLSFKGLGMYRSFEERWTENDTKVSPLPEAVTFEGQFYSIGRTGVTTVVKPTLEVNSFQRSRPCDNKTWKRSLVKSEDKLLLVEMCTETLNDYLFHLEQKGWFEVSELNEERKDWIQVEDLGGRVLFLNDHHCSFLCLPIQIPGFRPNSIIFMKHADHRLPQKFHNFYVFEFGEQGFKSFGDNPDNFQLFPSTEWLISNQ